MSFDEIFDLKLWSVFSFFVIYFQGHLPLQTWAQAALDLTLSFTTGKTILCCTVVAIPIQIVVYVLKNVDGFS